MGVRPVSQRSRPTLPYRPAIRRHPLNPYRRWLGPRGAAHAATLGAGARARAGAAEVHDAAARLHRHENAPERLRVRPAIRGTGG